jgi:hypothetical protein
MPALVAGIHAFAAAKQVVDARVTSAFTRVSDALCPRMTIKTQPAMTYVRFKKAGNRCNQEACRGGFQPRPASAGAAHEVFSEHLPIGQDYSRCKREYGLTPYLRMTPLPEGGFETRPYIHLHPCAT